MNFKLKRMIACVLVFIIGIGLMPSFASSAELDDYGTVRVLLSSMGSPTKVEIIIDGTYSINGTTPLTKGKSITASLESGNLMITGTNGKKVNYKTDAVIRRHGSDSITNCVKIKIGSATYSYPGDVVLQVNRYNYIYVIIKLYLEDYLRGVVPYEMSDSFPIEALKAQAVAARTYAMTKMDYKSAAYDIVDTTADQVFRGVSSSNTNAARAVAETAGRAVSYGGAFARVYYSASNGGLTELPTNAWSGGTNAPYHVVKADPYDLENASSRKSTLTIPKSYAEIKKNEKLDAIIKPAVEDKLKELKYSVEAGKYEIVGLVSGELTTPKYKNPDRQMTNLRLGVSAKVVGGTDGSEGTELAEIDTFYIDINIFSKLKTTFALGHQTADRELFTLVDSDENNFVLNGRRYGHGVGLSQRGAQLMANKYSMTFGDILDFYFPGTNLETYKVTRPTLPQVLDENTTTAGTPTEGKVKLNDPKSTLLMRKTASKTAAVIARLPDGTVVPILGETNGWYKITYNKLTGYVSSDYIVVTAMTTPTPTATPTATPTPTESPDVSPTPEESPDVTPTTDPSATPEGTPTATPDATTDPTDTTDPEELDMPTSSPDTSATPTPIGAEATPEGTATAEPTPDPEATQDIESAALTEVQIPTPEVDAEQAEETSASQTPAASTSPTTTATVNPTATTAATATATVNPTATTAATVKPTATTSATAAATVKPTATPAASASATVKPSATPTATPSAAPTATPTLKPVDAKVKISSGSAILREGPSAESKQIMSLTNGTALQILEFAEKWFKVSVSGKVGYISSALIGFENTREGTVTLAKDTSSLLIFKNPDRTSGQAGTLKHGTKVTILAEQNGWYYIRFDTDKLGFTSSAFIK